MAKITEGICTAGKTHLINPNLLFGQNSSDNIFVPPEELNIYVELTTSKKSRSIIDITDDGLKGFSTEKGKSRVSFIDGSPFGDDGKKSLSTSYTELTTVFNKTADTEKFGITSIDIDFNSAYAPIVKIEFVDVRGASLFNTSDGDGQGPKSEYASFFDLPYPIFELKVKGYYGKAVKYCLHLTKWNARFNSKTGNFEISADFIGYTYAMLTDMLLGYLRAITKTPTGIQKFNKVKSEFGEGNLPSGKGDKMITINELLSKIGDVNQEIKKLEDTDDSLAELNKNKALIAALEGIESILEDSKRSITEADGSSQGGYTLINRGGLVGVKSGDDSANTLALENFKSAMVVQVSKLNDILGAGNTIEESEFTTVPYQHEFIHKVFMSGITADNTTQRTFRHEWALGPVNWGRFSKKLEAQGLSNASKEAKIDLYDFSKTELTISKIKTQLNDDAETLKKNVGAALKGAFIETLGFEPTIRNIFRIFTVHSEIFMESLKDVSEKAENDKNKLRRRQLELLSDKTFDIHRDDTTGGGLPAKIYPWPLYRKPSTLDSKGQTLEEAWIGGDISNQQDVPEVVFVNELLEGLLAVGKEDIEREERFDNPNTIIDSWYPVNVLDTPLFGVVQNPYKTETIGDDPNSMNPLKLMMMRAFTFLGPSNRLLQPPEIEVMGLIEANSCYQGILDEGIRLGLIDTSKKDVDNVNDIIKWFKDGKKTDSAIINTWDDKDTSIPFMYEKDDYYIYDYLSHRKSKGDSGTQFIPFNGDFNGKEFYDDEGNSIPNSITLENSYETIGERGSVFLAPSPMNNFSGETGAIFMKIFSKDKYEDNTKVLRPNYPQQATQINKAINAVRAASEATPFLDSGTLYAQNRFEDDNDIKGWNILGNDKTATFAFTTVKIIDITNAESAGEKKDEKNWPVAKDNLPEAPLKALFYIDQVTKFGATCLSRKRIGKTPLELPEFKGEYETTKDETYYHTYDVWAGARPFSGVLGGSKTSEYPDLGLNRVLFNEDKVYIPFCDFAVTQRDWTNKYQVFSLFGSRLYFEQRRGSSPKASKALLYLHTHPWNQLYTDNVIKGNHGAAIFDNSEGQTISNLFNRKSAFLNVPYLWCAFMGGVLWRLDQSPIKYEGDSNNPDVSGKVPSYLGGSGRFDPIVWGKAIHVDNEARPDDEFSFSFVSEFNSTYGSDNIPKYAFPQRWQYLTSNYADAPFQLDTDANAAKDSYKAISAVLVRLPQQIKNEFKRIFFDFVNSSEWKDIRETYEVAPTDWNKDDPVDWKIEYGNDGFNNASWANGANSWTNKWNEVSKLTSFSTPIGTDNLYFTQSKKMKAVDPEKKKSETALFNFYNKSADIQSSSIKSLTGKIKGIKKSVVDIFPNVKNKNYEYFQPIRKRSRKSGESYEDFDEVTLKYDYDLALADNKVNETMVELFKRDVWIANASYKSWVEYKHTLNVDDDSLNPQWAKEQQDIGDKFAVKIEDLKTYLGQFVFEYKRLNELDIKGKEEEALKQQIFNSMDSDVIKLNIYRHCKSLYDKWIAGSGGSVMSTCGTKKPKAFSDKKVDIANKDRDNRSGETRLIDSFRFINRGFGDIGDDFLINPSSIGDIVIGNMNQSFYDLISRVLGDNNFNFIALPSYIDYSDINEITSIFKPEIYNQSVDDNISGPTFVCVYAGQSSNKLDLGKGSAFPNDGFDFKCDVDGNLAMGEGGLPKDFSIEKKEHEHNVVAFAVNYGQQNQNIFTNVELDQKEFAETDESLQITDSIAKNGSQSSGTQAGQNLWNVYQVRSYSSSITALGNAMIQPMMYYQLNNIPMFHGAYMIHHAKHKITPNHMKTTFKGQRTRYIDTPLMDSSTLYMSMLGTLSDVDSSGYKLGAAVSSNSNKNGTTTARVIEQGKYVSYEVKPRDGLVYQPDTEGDVWTMRAVGRFMETLATRWHQANQNLKNGDTLYICCFGAYGGGGAKGHSDGSLHYVGRAVDFRPVLKNKDAKTTTVVASNYDSDATIRLFQMAIDLSNEKSQGVQLNNMILNDKALINHFSGVKNVGGSPLVISVSGHENHIHFEFELPSEIDYAIERQEEQDRITSNEAAGQVSKETTKKATKDEKIAALGKI